MEGILKVWRVLIILGLLLIIYQPVFPYPEGNIDFTNWEDRLTRDTIKRWANGLFYTNLDNNRYVGGIISIVKDGQIVFEKGYGYADYFESQKADARGTPFRSGSTSKIFTAVAIMKELEKGNIDLNKNINRYLKRNTIDLPYGKVTVRHLLTHTAAFEERFRATLMKEPDNELATKEYLAKYEHNQIGKSGERIQYSNYGMGTLGVLLEDITELTYRQYLKKNIFEPLEMNNTYVETPDHLPIKKIAREHQLNNGKISKQKFYYKAPAYLGSGGLFYTAHDMALFMNAILNNSDKILKPNTWEEMKRVQESENPFTGVGYGFWIYERGQNRINNHWNGETIIGHSGGTQTFRSKMLLFPKANTGIFVATVGSANRTFKGQPSFNPHLVTNEFIESFRGEKKYDTSNANAPPDNLEQFEGHYYSTRRAWTGSEAFRDALIYEDLKVFSKNDKLYMKGFGAMNFFGEKHYKLKHLSKRTFLVENKDMLISFSEDGKFLTKDIYNNYDKVSFLRTPKALALVLLGFIVILLSSMGLLFVNRNKEKLFFGKVALGTSIIAIFTILFPFLTFGVFGVHYRLETDAFLINNVLGWTTLILSLLLTYVFFFREKPAFKIKKGRMIHSIIILGSLWILDYIFLIYDVIRLFES